MIGSEFFAYHEVLNTEALVEYCTERVIKYNKKFIKVTSFSGISDQELIYFTFRDKFEKLNELYLDLKEIQGLNVTFYRDIYTEDLWFLELHNKKASKYHAITFIKERYGFDRVIGFGDNLNDIPMFEACDECYSVKNANDALKQISTGIIKSNHENGVALWLNENLH